MGGRGGAGGEAEGAGGSTLRAVPDDAARVSNSSTHTRQRGEEADAAEAGAAKKKKTCNGVPQQRQSNLINFYFSVGVGGG